MFACFLLNFGDFSHWSVYGYIERKGSSLSVLRDLSVFGLLS